MIKNGPVLNNTSVNLFYLFIICIKKILYVKIIFLKSRLIYSARNDH